MVCSDVNSDVYAVNHGSGQAVTVGMKTLPVEQRKKLEEIKEYSWPSVS